MQCTEVRLYYTSHKIVHYSFVSFFITLDFSPICCPKNKNSGFLLIFQKVKSDCQKKFLQVFGQAMDKILSRCSSVQSRTFSIVESLAIKGNSS